MKSAKNVIILIVATSAVIIILWTICIYPSHIINKSEMILNNKNHIELKGKLFSQTRNANDFLQKSFSLETKRKMKCAQDCYSGCLDRYPSTGMYVGSEEQIETRNQCTYDCAKVKDCLMF